MMKKILIFGLTLTLLIPALAIAQFASPAPALSLTPTPPVVEETTSSRVMTIKSLTWLPEIFSEGENKLLKAKVDFHYEGEFITLMEDYYFSIHCSMKRQKRRGGYKLIYEEDRDLSILDEDALEIEGPVDFSVTFTFTFFSHEFEAAKKRGVMCDISPSASYYGGGKGGGDFIVTKFPEDLKTYGIRVRPKNGAWVVK